MIRPRFIKKGLKNPHLVRRRIKWKLDQARDFAIDRGAAIRRQEASKYGLVLSLGKHLLGRWSVSGMPYFVDQYIERFDPVFLSSQRIYERHKSDLEYIFSFEPGMTAAKLEYTGDHEVTCVWAPDPDRIRSWFPDYVSNQGFDYVLSPYYEPFLHHMPRIDEKTLIHFPWFVPDKYIIDPGEISLGDGSLGLFGAGNREAYRTRDYCRSFPFVEDHRISHNNVQYTGGDFYRWLRQFDAMIAAVTDDIEWDYLVAKYFEIPASGVLLFAEKCVDLERAGFNESNCVIFEREDFEDKAEAYLRAPEEYLSRRQNGVKLIAHNHSVSNRIQTVEDIFSG